MMNNYIRTMRKLVGSRCMFVPGVRAIIFDKDGKVLLQRRTDMPFWGLPSGSVELEESALEALKREVKEETTLEVLEAEPVALYSGPHQQFVYPNGDEVQPFSLVFIVRRWKGNPKADGVEGTELRWFSVSELPADIFPLHRKTLEDYAKYDGHFMLL